LKSAAHGNAGALVAAGLAIEASPKIPGETSISSRLAFTWALFDAASSLGRAEAAGERDRVGAKLPPEVLARAKTMVSELKAKVGIHPASGSIDRHRYRKPVSNRVQVNPKLSAIRQRLPSSVFPC
jgi:hypothetical protein